MHRLMIYRLGAALLVGVFLIGTTNAQDFRPPELDVQYHRAHTAWSTGNSLLEAKARIDRVLAELPDDVEALKLRAAILMDMARPEQALADANRATELAPDSGEAHLLRCEAAALTDQIPEAEEALETASNLFLERIDHYVRLSACALAIEANARAESLARVAVAQDDTDPRGHVQLARVFLGTNRSGDARVIIDRLIASNSLSQMAVMSDPQLARLYR